MHPITALPADALEGLFLFPTEPERLAQCFEIRHRYAEVLNEFTGDRAFAE
jgi:hypothetical protein